MDKMPGTRDCPKTVRYWPRPAYERSTHENRNYVSKNLHAGLSISPSFSGQRGLAQQWNLPNGEGVKSPYLLLFVIIPALLQAQTLQGKVVHIADGDTLTILVDHEQVKIRLAEVDAPESHQDYGQRAKQVLGQLVFGKEVLVDDEGKDRYGRTIGHVHLGSLDVNSEMVRAGYAWVYVKYARDQSLYALEREAREARRGLWASDVRVPPWEWRKEKRRRKEN